ncbi:MAG: sulfatase arylsulfatase, partial [Planctomycetes bacterium]|nr:sulfatase arylsulfatase [Planctomycetota bacterium]
MNSRDGSTRITRRALLGRAAGTAATLSAARSSASAHWLGSISRVSHSVGKKVIVIGIDGMDPSLTASMMKEGLLPNFAKMSSRGGFRPLGTSTPPQSPVAWANFINGSGPGSHGIFDFIHRHPHHQCAPFFSAAETLPAEGGWDIGDHRLHLDFWPFQHQPSKTVLRRQGVPFWDFLDKSKIPSTFYDIPANYPPSPSHYGHHRSISGMGTPDMLGTYGTYQFFSEDSPLRTVDEGGGKRTKLAFVNHTAKV